MAVRIWPGNHPGPMAAALGTCGLGARPHIPVDRKAPLADFERISPGYPVFRILPDTSQHPKGAGPR